MPRQPGDYFRYFPPHPDLAAWGIGVAACGSAWAKPGAPYPPQRHPADHHFDWSHGRVLDGLQIVHVVSGRGWLEIGTAGVREIGAGTAFLLPPGVWHRYQPDPATGWREGWVELRGPLVDTLRAGGVLAPDDVVRPTATADGLGRAMGALHRAALSAGPGFAPELSSLALAIVAAWSRAGERSAPPPSRLAEAVREAERYLAEHHTEAVNIAELAGRLGVAYSHFRREFKQRTGFSPWSYVVSLRLSRARRLLAGSDAKLEEIAERLGFSSAFHLSNSFRQAFGISPSGWRAQLRLGSFPKGSAPREADQES